MSIDVKSPGGSESGPGDAFDDAGGEGLFVRQSSGLVREIGWRETFAISASIIAFILLFFNFSAGLGASQNGDFYLPILVAGGAAVLTALTYAQLISAMPRSGGDYVFASRVAGPVVGAAVGGALLLLMMLNGGGNTLLFTNLVLPYFFQTTGDALGLDFLVRFATTISSETGFFISGSVFILVLGLFATRSVRSVTRVIFWGFVLALVGYVIALGQLLFHNHADFVNAFNQASSSPDAYSRILSDARKAGLETGITVAGMVSVYAWAYLAFGGFTLGVLAGGEVRRPGRTYRTAILAACFVATVVGLLSWAASRHIAGIDFLQAAPWLANNQPDLYNSHTSVSPLLGGLAYSTLVSADPVTKLIIVGGLTAAVIGAVLSLVLLTSRVVFALAFDRLLPTRLADVNQRTHAPINAIALTMVGMLLWNALGSYTSLLTVFRNGVLIGFSMFTVTSFMAMLLPFRRPEIFEAAPKIVKGSVLGVPAATVIAAGSVLVNGAATYLIATKAAISGGYSLSSVLTLCVIGLGGLVLYGVSRVYFAARGVNVNMAMRELPPE